MYIFFDATFPRLVVGLIAVAITVATHLFTRNNHIRLAVALVVLAVIVFTPVTAHNYARVNLSLAHFWKNPISTICNTVIFIPMAYYMRLTIKWQWCIMLVIATTIVIELIQLTIDSRITDVNDLLTNTIGGIVGILLATFVKQHNRRKQTNEQ